MTTVSLTVMTVAVTLAMVKGPGLDAELVEILLPVTKPSVIKLPELLVIVLPAAAKVSEMAPEFTGLTTTILPGDVGNVSVKLTLLTWTDVGLPIVNVSVDVPFVTIGLGLKLFEKVRAVTGSTIFAILAPTP